MSIDCICYKCKEVIKTDMVWQDKNGEYCESCYDSIHGKSPEEDIVAQLADIQSRLAYLESVLNL